jgi:RNA polymerase sigma-70 factor, ECF subfamily
MSNQEDVILIERTLQGDESAFAELVNRYQAAVWKTVYRTLGQGADTEDAVQEIFLRIFKFLGTFDRSLPFGPWIVRIATNYCIDQLRRRQKQRCQFLLDLPDAEQERALADFSRNGDFQILLGKSPETYEKVAEVFLDNLDLKYKMAFVLREVEKRGYSEIAEVLGTSQVTARVRVSRARAEIRRKFEGYLAEEARGSQP